MTKHDILHVTIMTLIILTILFFIFASLGGFVFLSYSNLTIKTSKLHKYIGGDLWVELAEEYPEIEFRELPHKKDERVDDIYKIEIIFNKSSNNKVVDFNNIINYVSNYLESNPDCKLRNKKYL